MASAKKILITSNDLELYRRLEKLLSDQGYQVDYAQSADSRLKSIIKRTSPDLIVVDPEPPRLKGIELSLLIRQWTPSPILILSTIDSEENEVRALDLKTGDCLSEPIDINLIATRINTILSESESLKP